jgi:hypothetical protein
MGDCITTLNGSATIAVIHALAGDEAMYNLTVADAHTYYVGAAGALVHNECDFWFESGVDELQIIEGNKLEPSVGADGTFQIYGRVNPTTGELGQIGIYDSAGDIIYHIDPPDSSTPAWHYHDFTLFPGDPSKGHGPNAPHHIIGDGSLADLIEFLRARGLGDSELCALRLIECS